ncbi:MAG: tyrosine-type recombinase/integrase, partial [Solirubrobacteraceae bacterium]
MTAKPRSSSARASASTSRRRPPEVLSEAEAIALLKACSSRAPTGVRNRALIAVLWRCGLRISEALSLELRDVDLDAGTVRVRHGK